MSYIINIGRQGNQPFRIGDIKVSSQHATLEVCDNGVLMLTDVGSTNGTWIFDGREFNRIYPGQKHRVTPETMIRLGQETQFHVRRLIRKQTRHQDSEPIKDHGPVKDPIRQDISFLRQVSEEYNARKLDIEAKVASAQSLKSATIIVSIVGTTLPSAIATALLGVDIKNGVNGLILALVTLGFVALLWSTLNSISNSKLRKANHLRQENERVYSARYCCPTCKASFRGKFYENVIGEGSCPRCKTKFFDSGEALRGY